MTIGLYSSHTPGVPDSQDYVPVSFCDDESGGAVGRERDARMRTRAIVPSLQAVPNTDRARVLSFGVPVRLILDRNILR